MNNIYNAFKKNQFIKAFKPIGKGIKDVFHHVEKDVKSSEHLIVHSFDNIVNKTAGSFNHLTDMFSNPLLILGAGAIVLYVITKK
jgi:hypothetical protein